MEINPKQACITDNTLQAYKYYLLKEEKSAATIEKYLRDVRKFREYLGENPLEKDRVLAYKEYLAHCYAPASANSMLVALNRFLRYLRREDCCVKTMKLQRQIFLSEERELSRAEFQRLVAAAKGSRMYYILHTICGTGIRVSELQYITAEAVESGRALVNCKAKCRVIFLPDFLRKMLKTYLKQQNVTGGPVFKSRTGTPLNRSNIWREMQALCRAARVEKSKVFPHNLRHLFARTFYSLEKDIVRLADILGHSSVNTTRIYTMETGGNHRMRLEKVWKILIT